MRIKITFALLLCLLLTACTPTTIDQVTELPLETEELTLETIPIPEPQISPFTLAYYPEYTTDPAYTAYRANLNLSGLLYEGLFQLDQNFVAQPLLCQSYTTSGDGLVWNFTLRQGVTFSDGTPLTAEVVASSLTASRQQDSRYAGRLSSISNIETAEDTLIITLYSPNNGLPTLLDVPITIENVENPLIPLGTGRYYLDGEQQILRGHQNYWQTALRVGESDIPLHAIRYADDLVSAFDAGYVSLVDIDLMGTQAPYFSSSYTVWDYPTSSLVYLAFNTREKENYSSVVAYESPCASVQLRQIIAMAVDRSTIVTREFAQHATAATLPIHPASPLYDVLLAATGDYSPAMLAAATADFSPLEDPLQFITANENASKLSTAQLIVDTLNSAGIYTQLVSLSWDDYLVALESGDFDLYLAETQLTADFDLTPLIGTEGALNYGEYSSAATDELISAFRSVPTSSQSSAASRLYTHILEETPIVPICFKSGSVLTQMGRVTELTSTQSNTFYRLDSWGFRDEF